MTIVKIHSSNVRAGFSARHHVHATSLISIPPFPAPSEVRSGLWPGSRSCRARVPPLPDSSSIAVVPRCSESRRTRSPSLTENRHRVLFLTADPRGATRLAHDEECAAIEHELRLTLGRDEFEFRSKWAVSVDEMMRHLNECLPTIVHFSGHGSDATGCAGIHLQDERRSQYVSARALAQMIASAAPSARVVVLNACFSDAVAGTLCDMVDCVVGMTGAIDDDAARSFAVSFYRALGNRRSIGNAVAQAVATLAAKQLPDEHRPVCRTRCGISADQLFLPSLNG
jgi:hypothetical protein